MYSLSPGEVYVLIVTWRGLCIRCNYFAEEWNLLNDLFKGELDVAQEIRVNQYETALSVLIYYCLRQSWSVVFLYSQLSSGFIQPPLLEPVVPTYINIMHLSI